MQIGDDGVPLSSEELKAIRTLKRLGKKWPSTLHLFASGSGSLHVLRAVPGEGIRMTSSGGFDQDGIVTTIEGISCDGGDA